MTSHLATYSMPATSLVSQCLPGACTWSEVSTEPCQPQLSALTMPPPPLLILPHPVIIVDAVEGECSSSKHINFDDKGKTEEQPEATELSSDACDPDEDTFVDALEVFSKEIPQHIPEEDVIYNFQPKKMFPPAAGVLLYGALKTHMESSNITPPPSDAGSSRASTQNQIFSAASDSSSQSSLSQNWSTQTIYTTTSHASLSSSVSSGTGSVRSEASAQSELSAQSKFQETDTCSHQDKFRKGVPWGFHGRDYVGPVPRNHHLRTTMRDQPPSKGFGIGERLSAIIKRIFGRGKTRGAKS
jgi:hypothetical protein